MCINQVVHRRISTYARLHPRRALCFTRSTSERTKAAPDWMPLAPIDGAKRDSHALSSYHRQPSEHKHSQRLGGRGAAALHHQPKGQTRDEETHDHDSKDN